MTEEQRAYFRRVKRKQDAERRRAHKAAGERMLAEIIATTRVPFDPLGRSRFQELKEAIREGRA